MGKGVGGSSEVRARQAYLAVARAHGQQQRQQQQSPDRVPASSHAVYGGRTVQGAEAIGATLGDLPAAPAGPAPGGRPAAHMALQAAGEAPPYMQVGKGPATLCGLGMPLRHTPSQV